MSFNIQTTNFINIGYAAAGDIWEVPAGIDVTSKIGDAVASGQRDSLLLNHGDIEGSYSGVTFAGGGNDQIINFSGGNIGGAYGITVNNFWSISGPTSTEIINLGSVDGYRGGVAFGGGSSGSILDNRGFVYGIQFGVEDFSFLATAPNEITNTGTIEGGTLAAIYLIAAVGKITQVTNSGMIVGDAAHGTPSVFGVSGTLLLQNSGTLIGSVDLAHTSPSDHAAIVNSGRIAGDVYLGPGNDDIVNIGHITGRSISAAAMTSSTAAAPAARSASSAAPATIASSAVAMPIRSAAGQA